MYLNKCATSAEQYISGCYGTATQLGIKKYTKCLKCEFELQNKIDTFSTTHTALSVKQLVQ